MKNILKITFSTILTFIVIIALVGCNKPTPETETITQDCAEVLFSAIKKDGKTVGYKVDSVNHPALQNKPENFVFEIPETNHGLPVLSISADAFYSLTELNCKVSIPNSITDIESYGTDNLNNSTEKDGVLYYGNTDNPYMIAVDIVNSDTPPTSINFQNGCRFITIGSIETYDSITKIIIPDTIEKINSTFFYTAEVLKDLGELDIKYYNKKDGVNYVGNEKNPYLVAVSLDSFDITDVTIQEGCKIIDIHKKITEYREFEYKEFKNTEKRYTN